MISEFGLIERFFRAKAGGGARGVTLGIGDDCALLHPAPGQELAISTDMLLEGRHFLPAVPPAALGHKALAVNLSDLAAMGAEPLAFTLALALPPERAADAAWLDALSDGMLALARKHGCALVGGDTTAGPLNLCITVFGQVPAKAALRRDGARAGDEVWVSGTLGDARLALGALRGEWTLPDAAYDAAIERMARPIPRVALGLALRGLAASAIDVSDGLLGDLGHILAASGVGSTLDAARLPPSPALAQAAATEAARWNQDRRLALVLAGGDDYELVFTAPSAAHVAVVQAGVRSATRVTCIGRIDAASGLRVLDTQGQPLDISALRSFDHFAG